MLRKSLAIGVLAVLAFVPVAASAATGYVAERAKLRAGPDAGYPTVAVVQRGDGLEIHGCLANRSWCDVGFNGDRGWLPGRAILSESVRGRVPIATADGDLGTMRFNLDEYWDTNYHGRFDQRRGRWQSYYHSHDRDWDRDHDHDRDHDGR